MTRLLVSSCFALLFMAAFGQSEVNDTAYFLDGRVASMVIQPDGKILVGGEFADRSNGKKLIVRLNNDGSLDPGFEFPTDLKSTDHELTLQPDGKVLLWGSDVKRYNSNGSLDHSFKLVSMKACEVKSIAIQPNGKILLAGLFGFGEDYKNVLYKNVLQLNSDGSLDSDFHSQWIENYIINALALQTDGRIILAGDVSGFRKQTAPPVHTVVRLNGNGKVDPSFNSGYGATVMSSFMTIALQADGKILIAGRFTTYDGAERNNIARINRDGSLDLSFDPGKTLNGGVSSMLIQSNGKILVVGSSCVRFEMDGTKDLTFDLKFPLNGGVQAMVSQPDGKFLIGGKLRYMTNNNELATNHIQRFNSDGALDLTFDASKTLANKIH